MAGMTQNDNMDLDYILSHYDQEIYEIPYSYDTLRWKLGETYKIRIGNIYDPSKFWIVHFEKELSLFYNFMNDFYNRRKEEYRMPRESIKRNHYCAVFTDNGYYRGIIVDIPKFNSIETKVIVFLFDFGFTNVVTIDNLYYLYEKMYKLPRYAIRARLHGIEPYNTDTWTNTACEKFKELTQGKVLLCILGDTHPRQRTVYIRIVELVQFSKINDIGEVLTSEKMAKLTAPRRTRSKKVQEGKLVPKVRYPFLCPSFDAIENGMMPSTVFITECLKNCVTSSILFKPYYNYNGVELRD